MQKLMIATVAAAALMSFAAVAQTPKPADPASPSNQNYSAPMRDGPNSNCETIVDAQARSRCLNSINPDPSQAQAPRASGSGTTNAPSTTPAPSRAK